MQLFFPGPPFQKSDHAGVVSPVKFFLAHLNSIAIFQRFPETLGFVAANHAGFRRMPETVVTQGKNSVQFSETIGVFWFSVFGIGIPHFFMSLGSQYSRTKPVVWSAQWMATGRIGMTFAAFIDGR
jgi:hypothetical protein